MHLELARLDGKAFVRLSDFADKLVVLNFWRSDCPPCVAEMPLLSAFGAANPEVQLIGISTEEPSRAQRFVDLHRIHFMQLKAPPQSDGLMRRFGNTSGALPYTVVLDARHRNCRSRVGAVDEGWLQAAIGACKDHSNFEPRPK